MKAVVFEYKHVQFLKWTTVFAIMLVANIFALIPKSDPVNAIFIYSLYCIGVQLWERNDTTAAMCDALIFAGAVVYLAVIAFTGVLPNLGLLISVGVLGIPGVFSLKKIFT